MPIDNACPAPQTDVCVRRSTAWTPDWSKFFSGLLYWVIDRQRAYRHHVHLSQLDEAALRDLGLPSDRDTWDGFTDKRF
jgi:hypothetical protein